MQETAKKIIQDHFGFNLTEISNFSDTSYVTMVKNNMSPIGAKSDDTFEPLDLLRAQVLYEYGFDIEVSPDLFGLVENIEDLVEEIYCEYGDKENTIIIKKDCYQIVSKSGKLYQNLDIN